MLKPRLLIVILAGLVGALPGQSEIVYSSGPSFQIPPFDGSRGADLDGDAAPDFLFWSTGALGTMDVPSSGFAWPFYVGAAGANQLLRSDYALALPCGARITGSFILTGSTLRGELRLAGRFRSPEIRSRSRGRGRPVATMGQPLISKPGLTVFFAEINLSQAQVLHLRRGAYEVSVDGGVLRGVSNLVQPSTRRQIQ